MKVSSVFISQGSLRNIAQIHEMIEFVRNGGFWTKEELLKYAMATGNPCCGLIKIHKLNDVEFLHDGHHRMVATFLAGREYLRQDEYAIESWPYHDPINKIGYLDINHEKGWYTPFDPRTHLKVPDIREFKVIAKNIFEKNPEEAIRWIEANTNKFRSPVTNIRTVADLSNSLFPERAKL